MQYCIGFVQQCLCVCRSTLTLVVHSLISIFPSGGSPWVNDQKSLGTGGSINLVGVAAPFFISHEFVLLFPLMQIMVYQQQGHRFLSKSEGGGGM